MVKNRMTFEFFFEEVSIYLTVLLKYECQLEIQVQDRTCPLYVSRLLLLQRLNE